MYYHDPDRNQVELLVDNFATAAEGRAYMQSRSPNDKNPVGIVYEPEELVDRVRSRPADRGTRFDQLTLDWLRKPRNCEERGVFSHRSNRMMKSGVSRPRGVGADPYRASCSASVARAVLPQTPQPMRALR